LLFSLFAAPLAGLVRVFGVKYHQYADYTQLYIAISKIDVELQRATLAKCISSVHQWLLHNVLSLIHQSLMPFSSLLVVNGAMQWTTNVS
jgi:hypothetical protein